MKPIVFSSVIFLFYFLPAVIICYYAGTRFKLHNIILLIASLLFYAWGEPVFVLVMLASIVVNYVSGLVLGLLDRPDRLAMRKLALVISVVLNLGILFYFKYTGFALSILSQLLTAIGMAPLPDPSIALPIGISFFTFQGLSYVIDVYRRRVPVQKNILHIALYIAMFPQLIAGPIVRYESVNEAILHRTHTLDHASAGIQRFIIGLAKKVILADVLAATADMVFAVPAAELTAPVAWLGAVTYTLQIYFDFSGYSDMAIGLGMLFGFSFPENFNLPYLSRSVTEFWRKWHISLSSWFRDYLYIPMGGNRRGNVYLHLIVVFLCTGLWHGAAFTFVLWGLWHGLFLIVERVLKKRNVTFSIPGILQWAYTMLVVMLGWVLFRSDNLPKAAWILRTMFGLQQPTADFIPYSFRYYWDPRLALTLILAVLVGLGIPGRVLTWLRQRRFWPVISYLRIPLLCLMLLLSLSMVVNGNYSPFIYFRF